MPLPVPMRLSRPTQIDEAAILRTLNAFAVDLITIPSEEDLFWYVAKNVVGQLNFVDCVIYRANEAQTELTQVAALGEKNPYGRSIVNPLVMPFGTGITGQVAEHRMAMIVDDLLKDQNYIPDTQPARSEICVPLIFRGRVVGVIDSEHPEPGAFGPAELEILTTVAAMTSAKLELLAEAQRSHQRYHDLLVSHAQLTAETNNRKALEAKLFEARKLEAIGRLTGRFAHDFNNLLTIISGNLELIAVDDPSDAALDSLSDAQAAAARGARLIRDMLAFAQRTRLEPSVVDLNSWVKTTCTQGNRGGDVVVDLHLADSLWPVWVDARVMENAVANLLDNARDAMPDGGTIRITTENITHGPADNRALSTDLAPGTYVRLGIADSGAGIAANRLQQIFDPFFTSKATGSGTGLGLSMVLGFVQQSGGGVSVTSGAGFGSRFDLYFPTAAGDLNDLLTIIE